ncbi:2-oxoacid:acceptor oxidoreductase subunit alpha [Marinigracilibium pacificum]|uniref:2-oxoacid:acceptor oxidoreductase subunit alpha n=1 Tax=Marinigracilibium pacificum TaxID=2729599 RepID=A0A848J214_9BACT|nr:2-oxoacid:acceptor oxidoreductase subunit alpha [Marinigracilibium pacificum]NMM48580.1 2-oxoacid:acceptor oxidoreductase subunit alpha [Marinigracilibium pacificum]
MKEPIDESRDEVVIHFAGDSGDGIQLTGGQFTETVELFGNDISTFPNFPAEIRAPIGTLAGVSGFQLKFGSVEVFTPGDKFDVLVVMNAAALKINLKNLKQGGIIIANTSGFDSKNLKLAKYIDGENPLIDHSLDNYQLHAIDITKLTREALKELGLGVKEVDRCKNMFVLGYVYWMFSQTPDNTIKFIREKFSSKPEIAEANINALKTGYHFGDTNETFKTRFRVKAASLPKGKYRNINGNRALALALISAAHKNNLDLFYASYPITPASDILHELSRHKNFGVKTYQAEDEIAAACAAIGASFGGALAVTGSSGPGIALKGEALGLAVILEIPMIIVNVQRGGPSTGLPTKTEQADLLQAVYGRNGEAPIPVLAASSPKDCFDTAYEACRIAVEHMTPVLILSDGYIANGSEPWSFPTSADLGEFKIHKPKGDEFIDEQYLPYSRDKNLVRPWVIPGMKGYTHRVGGLEKEDLTGNVSYDGNNHEKMVGIRAEKVNKIGELIPLQEVNRGEEGADILVLGWGSTYGAIETATKELIDEGLSVAHIHLRYLFPFPSNLGKLLKSFKKVLIPEMNRGQLSKLIRDQFLIDAKTISKVKGIPFTIDEIKEQIIKHSQHVNQE